MQSHLASTIAVVIVTYESAGFISPCLESLMLSEHAELKVVICDNNSPDDTIAQIHAWARQRGLEILDREATQVDHIESSKLAPVTLIRSARNLGFAGGVNLGLRVLVRHQEVGLFWLLNPDCTVMPDTATRFANAAKTARFGLMGGRNLYHEPPNLIQSDGGRVNFWTGMCRNTNQGLAPWTAQPPDPKTLDFISGASVVASREFIEKVGLLQEDYFLYYEEVDWAVRRGNLTLVTCPDAIVLHHGGTSIGTGSVTRRPSAFANYFNYRNRMWFVWRFKPIALPLAYAYSLARVLKLVLIGAWDEAAGAACGLHQLPPPTIVMDKLSPEARVLAFGTRNR